MKAREINKIFATIFLLITSYIVLADVFDDIALAIKSGNYREVAKYFGTRVELKINNADNMYSKAQAELILKEFFDNNPPVNFTIKHKSNASKGLQYVIGYLQTTTGKFRTYILLKEYDSKLYIQEMQFDKEN